MIKLKKINFEYFVLLFLIAFALVFTFFGFSYATLDGAKLFFYLLFPSLFPYLFIIGIINSLSATKKLFNKLNKPFNSLFNVSGLTGYVFILTLFSGYPLGAKLITDLYNKKLISIEEANRGYSVCFIPSTALISTVTKLFGKRIGIMLLISSLITYFAVAFIFSFYKRNVKPLNRFETAVTENVFYDNISSTVSSTLTVGSIIILFYVFTEVLYKTNMLSPLISFTNLFVKDENASLSIVFGLFEISRFLSLFSKCSVGFFTLPVISGLLNFGGLSVIMQTKIFMQKNNAKPFFVSRVLAFIISFTVAVIIELIFGF